MGLESLCGRAESMFVVFDAAAKVVWDVAAELETAYYAQQRRPAAG
jgi:hypothetical protein